MAINIDMTGVQTSPTPLPPGYYQAEVVQCEVKKSAAGNDYISWGFNITEGDYAGRKAWHNSSLLPQALWSFKKVLIALGFPKEDLAGEIQFDPAAVLQQPCTLVVVEDEWQGETKGRVDKVLTAGIVGAVM